MTGDERRRRVVAGSGTAVLLGIAMSVTELRAVGSMLTVGALLVLIAALHRLGRSGPDAPPV